MTNVQKLQAWVEEEKNNGLIDIKFYLKRCIVIENDIEKIANSILALLTGPTEDITNQSL